jgi:uncharacterized membrane protein
MTDLIGPHRVWTKVVGSAALGAAAMFVLDPDKGRRRRALARDKATWIARRTGGVVDAARRDVRGRWQGVRARGERFARRAGQPSDDVLRDRVRARLGRVVSHPHAIAVDASGGRVTLTGPILAHEAAHLLDTVRGLAGVKILEDKLDRHQTAQSIPSLRGAPQRQRSTLGPMQRHWTPALRVGAMAAGGLLALYGLRRGGFAGRVMSAIGAVLAVRGAANEPLARLAARGRDARFEKAITIAAKPETVFDAWTHYDNFPRFMSHVIEVRDLGDGRSHWIVDGPAGTTLEWNSTITRMVANRRIEWRSDPGSAVAHAAAIRFEPCDRGTRVLVRMAYPAALFGRDAKRRIDDDLLRMKEYVEAGATAHDAAATTS